MGTSDTIRADRRPDNIKQTSDSGDFAADEWAGRNCMQQIDAIEDPAATIATTRRLNIVESMERWTAWTLRKN